MAPAGEGISLKAGNETWHYFQEKIMSAHLSNYEAIPARLMGLWWTDSLSIIPPFLALHRPAGLIFSHHDAPTPTCTSVW